MSAPRPAAIVIAAIVLAVALVSWISWPRSAASDETEVIRGTVDRWRPGILVLTDVKLHDGTDAGRPVMIIVNKDTAYFDGAVRTTKDAVTTGLKVLVKCERAGTGRVGVLVRIVGGKSP